MNKNNPNAKFTFRYFERMVAYCSKYGGLIPLSFVLGFYVNIVYTRWWNQYTTIPFPDSLAILTGATIKGQVNSLFFFFLEFKYFVM